MIYKKINLKKIDFMYTNYLSSLMESIKNRGIVIPIKVNIENDRYRCIDGNKRLSVLKDLGIEEVYVSIINDFSKAGSGYWGNTRNKH